MDAKTVALDLGEKSYLIHIGRGWETLVQKLFSDKADCASSQRGLSRCRKALIVTDENVNPLYGSSIFTALNQAGIKAEILAVPPGESSKDLGSVEGLYTAALKAGLDRSSMIVALGGGVVGDLAGFIAATYMRGISFLQIPTSLLAQVDSSIGGKVAVNHPLAKNIIGAFHQPAGVLINIDTLATLPPRELSTGMAELIKHGFIYSSSFLNWLEENLDAVMELDGDALTEAVYQSCTIKAAIVSQDEKEQGLRAILNFGHTIGHGIEAVAGYGRYTHGEAVAIGMVTESYIALLRGLINESCIDRIKGILIKAGLPVRMPSLEQHSLLQAMRHDKKNTGDKIAFVLLEGPGKTSVYRDVDAEIIKEAIKLAQDSK